MHRDLLDALRCPRDHDESWLVAMVTRSSGAALVDADLACPMCGAEFTVRESRADFGDVPRESSGDHPEATRVAALLGAASGAMPLLLTGHYARAGAAIALLVDAPQVWLDAPEDADSNVPMRSRLYGASRLPLGVETLSAAAVDPAHGDPQMLASITRALRVGGRLLSSTTIVRPTDLREIARDDREWVAETTTRASGLIELRRTARQ